MVFPIGQSAWFSRDGRPEKFARISNADEVEDNYELLTKIGPARHRGTGFPFFYLKEQRLPVYLFLRTVQMY